MWQQTDRVRRHTNQPLAHHERRATRISIGEQRPQERRASRIRSGGREPAVGTGGALARAYSHPPQTDVARTGAAGVSPPCVGARRCNGLTATARETADCALMNAVPMALAHQSRGAYAPPRSCYRVCECDRAIECLAMRERFRKPRGADAPRSCSHGVRLPAKLRLLRYTNAHAPRAVGVSPPWRSGTALTTTRRPRPRIVVAHSTRSSRRQERCCSSSSRATSVMVRR